MKNAAIALIIGIIIGLGAWYFLSDKETADDTPLATASSFDECVKAGFPVMESYPRQCKTPDNKTFVEDIGNELEKNDMIRLDSPRPNALVKSPLLIDGEARGTWYFEASFVVTLTDANGKTVARGLAEAQSEWMTEDFVQFKSGLSFNTMPETETGYLILEKENPSGEARFDDELKIPVRFK